MWGFFLSILAQVKAPCPHSTFIKKLSPPHISQPAIPMVSNMSMPTPGRKLQEVPSSPARSGMQTPPFHTSAAVPFRWEEEPGKPWPCAALVIVPTQPEDFAVKSLEVPPGLLNVAITKKIPAPPASPIFLEGPRLRASSFRMDAECYGSFRRLEGEDSGWGDAGAVCKRRIMGSAWFGSGSGRKSGINEKVEIVGSRRNVFPSVDRESDCDWGFQGQENCRRRMRRTSSFPILPLPKSHFWRSIYEGLKGALPWRSRTLKKKMGSRSFF